MNGFSIKSLTPGDAYMGQLALSSLILEMLCPLFRIERPVLLMMYYKLVP